jgi:hypothetical protein
VVSKPKQPDAEPSGRIAFDDRGNATWEWRTDTGTFSREIDTQRLKALQEAAAAGLAQDSPAVADSGMNPYSSADRSLSQENPGTRRRTLSDMRELSEQIKRARASKKPED